MRQVLVFMVSIFMIVFSHLNKRKRLLHFRTGFSRMSPANTTGSPAAVLVVLAGV